MEAINQALVLFKELGIDPLFLIGVVFLTALLKSFDRKNRFKQGYVLFPLLASLLLFATEKPFVLASYAVNSLVHAALGAYGYNLYSNLLKRKPKE